MRKILLPTFAAVSGILIAGMAPGQQSDPRVSGSVTQIHAGTLLLCFVVKNTWYALENTQQTQVNAVLDAASDGAQFSFLVFASQPPVLCHGTQPAQLVHDIDRVY